MTRSTGKLAYPYVAPEVRLYIYRVIIALGVVGAAIGWWTDTDFTVWLGLAAAILGNVQAQAYVPKRAAGESV